MKQVTIDNPILNAPFAPPDRHFKFSSEGITNEIADGRRTSVYFVPIAKPKKSGGKQKELFEPEEWIQENELVNRIRQRVGLWRERGHPDITPATRRLLDHWIDPNRGNKLIWELREDVLPRLTPEAR